MELKPGEIICDRCHGAKVIEKITNYKRHHHSGTITSNVICEHCKGEGKLNWIERVVGKKEEDIIINKREHQILIEKRTKTKKYIERNDMKTLKINVSGAANSGKTTMGEFLLNLLKKEGFECSLDDTDYNYGIEFYEKRLEALKGQDLNIEISTKQLVRSAYEN